MAKSLSLKNIPPSMINSLRKRAKKHRRSLQGELCTIIEETLESDKKLSMAEAIKKIKQLKVKTGAESVQIIKTNRNERS